MSSGALLIKDHSSYELADFIEIDSKKKRIRFFHCKKSGQAKPGANVKDCYDVLGQACRNRLWIRSPGLMTEVKKRVDSTTRSTQIVKGAKGTLTRLSNSFSSNAWSYEVVAVQPGIDCAKVTKKTSNNNVNSLLAATFDWLAAADAQFVVWGS